MSSTDTVADILVVDRGPILNAARILVQRSTLAEHCTITDQGSIAEIAMTGDIPFDYWGSGTQALWRLLSAIAYTRHEVSLYEVVSRLDSRNTAAVADAVAALCGRAVR